MVTQDKLMELLKEGKVAVTFTKKDGTTRLMNCTLSKDVVPFKKPEPQPVSESPSKPARKVNPNQIRVYDIDNGQWRSFNYTSVVDVQLPEIRGVDPGTRAVSIVVFVAFILYCLVQVS